MDTTGIRKAVLAVLADSPPYAAPGAIAKLCHRIAFAYLSGKVASGRLHPQNFGLSLPDLAFDSIADLFQRNAAGQFPEFRRYFQCPSTQCSSDSVAFGALQRLVVGHVNQHLYRCHREFDPTLGRVIRNIKLALKRSRRLVLEENLGEPWMFAVDASADDRYLPVMSPELLERLLSPVLANNGSVAHALDECATILCEHVDYRRAYPVVGLALVFRSIMKHLAESEPVDDGTTDGVFSSAELSVAVARACRKVKARAKPSYVGRGKVTEAAFDGYFRAIEEMLLNQYASADGVDQTYYDYVNRAIGPMRPERYRDFHRTKFEYLSKMARRELINDLRGGS